MKRILGVLMGALSIAAVAAGPAAAANPACSNLDIYCADTNDADAGSGNPLEPITSALPAQGILSFGYNSSLDITSYWLFYDGDEDNGDPFDGYLGISGGDLERVVLGLVGNPDGNFKRAGNNTELVTLLPGFPSLGVPPKFKALPGLGVPAVPGLPLLPSGSVIVVPVQIEDAIAGFPGQVQGLVGALPSLPVLPVLLPTTFEPIPGFPNLLGLFPRK